MLQHYTIVARRNEAGQVIVPFDADPSEEAAHHRKVMIGHLVDQGHRVEAAPDGSHVILHSGPMTKAHLA